MNARAPQLLNRVRRISGQMEAVERALNDEVECARVMQLIASVRGAINGLMAEVIEEHVRHHIDHRELAESLESGGASPSQGAEELIEVIRTYLK